jgi:hypothetical protein
MVDATYKPKLQPKTDTSKKRRLKVSNLPMVLEIHEPSCCMVDNKDHSSTVTVTNKLEVKFDLGL